MKSPTDLIYIIVINTCSYYFHIMYKSFFILPSLTLQSKGCSPKN